MAKKKKNKFLRKVAPIVLILGGAALALYGRGLFSRLTDKFLDGIGFKLDKVKFKFTSLTAIKITVSSTITNQNSFGVTASKFQGKLTYGRGGAELAPLALAAPVTLPANGSANADIVANINLFSLASSGQQVWNLIKSGELKKAWVTGTLTTNVVAFPIDTEISLFEE